MGCSHSSTAAGHEAAVEELEPASGGGTSTSSAALPSSAPGEPTPLASLGPSDAFVRAACALQLQELLRRHPFLEPRGCFQAHPLHLWVNRCREGFAANKFKAAQEDLRRIRKGLEAESRQLGEAFRRFDRDASGHLDDVEFDRLCAYLGWGKEQADLMDLDGDGRISLSDFEAFVGHLGGVQSLFERRRLRATASRKDVCDYAGIVVGSRVRAHFYVHRRKSRTWREASVVAVNMEYRMAGPGATSLGVLLEFRFGHGGKGGKGWPARQVVPMSWVLSSVEDASVATALREVGILDEQQAFWALLLPDSEMHALARLEGCQRNALSWVRQHTAASHARSLPKVQERFRKLGYGEQELQVVLDWVQDLAPVIVHLNLDSMGRFMESDEFYRNQFETKTSNGALDMDNSTRKGWEHDLFGGAYDSAKPFERPKYGVLNVMNDYRGVISARQYGDSYLVLKDVRLRLTFCSTDSGGIDGHRLAVLDQYAHVLQEYNDHELRSLIGVATAAIAPEEEGGGRAPGAAQLQLLRGESEDPASQWITVGFPGLAQCAGRFFFEVHLSSGCSAPQVGCLSSDFVRAVGTKYVEGVGDDAYGWAVDGLNSARWHEGCPKAWATCWPSQPKGDARVLGQDVVVGIAVDLDKQCILCASNGTWEDAPVFTAAELPKGTALYPALSVMGRAAFSFGPDFKHTPPPAAGTFAQWPGTFGGLVRVDCPHIGNSEVLQMYKEIQIHGALSLKDNVQRLVAAEKYRQRPKAQRSFLLRVVNAGPCTGTYERAGAHAGMPLYRAASGAIIYWDKETTSWRMNETEDFTKFRCSAVAAGAAAGEPPRAGWEVPDEQHGILPSEALQRALQAQGVGSEDAAGVVKVLGKEDSTSGQLMAYRKLAGRSLASECERLGKHLQPDELWEAAQEEWRQQLLREAGLDHGRVLETTHPYEAKRTQWKKEVSFEGASALTVYFSSRCCTYDSKASFKVYAGGLLRSNAGVGARVELKALGGSNHTVHGTVLERQREGDQQWRVLLDRSPVAEDPAPESSSGANFQPAVGNVVEAKYKNGIWYKAWVTEIETKVNWYDATREPVAYVIKWLEGGLEDDREKDVCQIRRPRSLPAGARVLEALPRAGKVPFDNDSCFAVCMETPLSISVTYKAGTKVGDEIKQFTLDRTCPLAPISVGGFAGEGPAQAEGVKVGWYLNIVATAQGSSKAKLMSLLEGIGGVGGPEGTSVKAKNQRLNKLLDAAFANMEDLVCRLNEDLLAMTDVKLVLSNSSSPQVVLLPEVITSYTADQKVSDEITGFTSLPGGNIGITSFTAPGPAQEAGVRTDWLLDPAKTLKQSGSKCAEAGNTRPTWWPSSILGEATGADAAGPPRELAWGAWASEKGGCRIFVDEASGKLFYEEELPEGAGVLHGELVWQSSPGCWQASLLFKTPPEEPEGELEQEGEEAKEPAGQPEVAGEIRAFVSQAAPLTLETRIHVAGEDVEWHPPVVWQRDLAKDPNALLNFSGLTLVFRQPNPSKSVIFKGSGAREEGKRWTCGDLAGSSADFEFSTDGDGADHPERRWGVWALALPKEAPPPDTDTLDRLADRWAESLAKAEGIREVPQVERDGWDEQRLRALCARHGWEFEWMTEDGERRRQLGERHGLGGGRVDLAAVRKVASERLPQVEKNISKQDTKEVEKKISKQDTKEVAGAGEEQHGGAVRVKRSASGLPLH